MFNVTMSQVSCGWADCPKDDCLGIKDSEGRLTRIPACPKHSAQLKRMRSLYKQCDNLRRELMTCLPDTIKEARLEILGEIKHMLRIEMRARIKQTDSLKLIYQDKGHLFYIETLLKEYSAISKDYSKTKSLLPSLVKKVATKEDVTEKGKG